MPDIETFITKWAASGGSERANFQTFAIELCALLGVPPPDPAIPAATGQAYRFEHSVTFIHTDSQSHGFIDLYRAGHFVMEAKQGITAPDPGAGQPEATRIGHGRRGTGQYAAAMIRARNQADGYARAVSRDDGWPPFLLVVDVGHVIEVYADFSGQGQA